ncbi:MAG: hypothetical protein AB1689_03375, partial [Thermodesulfobacteriota bacterium]
MSESPTRSAADGEGTRRGGAVRALAREARAAMLFLTGTAPARLVPEDVAKGGLVFPAVGFVLGALVAAVLLAAERRGLPGP